MPWKNDQVSAKETEKIAEIARKCGKLPGDFVEMGCYKGDTSLVLASILRELQRSTCGKLVENSANNPVENSRKKLWIYDSFEGLPEKQTADASPLGTDFTPGALATTKREVKNRFLRANLPLPIIKKAWFSDLTPEDLPRRIAFAFLDGDFYDSIRVSLRLVFPNLIPGSVIIIHDYYNPALPGVARAADEFPLPPSTRFESMKIIQFP